MHSTSLNSLIMVLLAATVFACDASPAVRQVTSIPKEDWAKRQARISSPDSLLSGSTYLSSYSEIYTKSENHTFSLTGTISLRNVNLNDTIYIDEANYHKTSGLQVRTYFDAPIFLAPMETVEIIITDDDIEGGTGDNFVFHWRKPPGTNDPFFEGVFISVYGQQGISFTTSGIRIK